MFANQRVVQPYGGMIINRAEMQFLLVYSEDEQIMRVALWNPAGYWERPHPIGSREDMDVSHWQPLPAKPTTRTGGVEG